MLFLGLPTPDCLSPFDFGLFVKGGLMGDIIILESSSSIGAHVFQLLSLSHVEL